MFPIATKGNNIRNITKYLHQAHFCATMGEHRYILKLRARTYDFTTLKPKHRNLKPKNTKPYLKLGP
jgi:hypothetical protein